MIYVREFGKLKELYLCNMKVFPYSPSHESFLLKEGTATSLQPLFPVGHTRWSPHLAFLTTKYFSVGFMCGFLVTSKCHFFKST